MAIQGPYQPHQIQIFFFSLKNFDSWAKKKKIINEFIRFSFSPDNRVFAHPETEVLLIESLQFLGCQIKKIKSSKILVQRQEI